MSWFRDNDRMMPPPSPVDWTALDRPTRREALGALKARLQANPADQSTRGQIVNAYRQLGNPDQAGRFAIGLDERPKPEEVRAYSAMVRALNADESTTRRLCLVTAEVNLPDQVMHAIEGRAPDDGWRSWGVLLFIVWAIWVALSLVCMVVVFGFAVAGARDVQLIAQWWTALGGWALVVALLTTAVWCAASGKWIPALVWSLITVVVAGSVVLASIALLR